MEERRYAFSSAGNDIMRLATPASAILSAVVCDVLELNLALDTME
jgi:high-affinity K+ transport system ATPase subunit B